MKELKSLAETVRKESKLKYDEQSVKYIERFIERSKKEIPKEQCDGLINALAAFLGQCIIQNYGGQWDKTSDGNIGVKFDDKNWAFPFAKVSKQFENGLEDSIHAYYTIIPMVFKLN